MTYPAAGEVRAACPEDLTVLSRQGDRLCCSECGRLFSRIEGVYDLLPREVHSPTSRLGIRREQYARGFTQREDRWYYQPLRRCLGAVSNGYLYRWASREVRAFAAGRPLTVLDAACGDAAVFRYLPRNTEYVGIDFSLRVLGRAARYFPAQYFLADLNRLPFPSDSFDVVVSLQSLQYLEAPENALLQMARVLRPAGRLFLALPNHDGYKYRLPPSAPPRFRHLSPDTIRDLIEPMFQPLEIQTRGFWVPFRFSPIHLPVHVSVALAVSVTVAAAVRK